MNIFFADICVCVLYSVPYTHQLVKLMEILAVVLPEWSWKTGLNHITTLPHKQYWILKCFSGNTLTCFPRLLSHIITIKQLHSLPPTVVSNSDKHLNDRERCLPTLQTLPHIRRYFISQPIQQGCNKKCIGILQPSNTSVHASTDHDRVVVKRLTSRATRLILFCFFFDLDNTCTL